MTYVSLYRRWRPQTFREVVGQEHVTRTLRNAIAAGRTSHAYLFCGPRGTGKTSVAKVLAKALNCNEGPTPDPCDRCEACVRIREGHSMDVIEIDAASNRGIDEIRELREKVKFAPAQERYKVYIIDEVHMLTQEAFNALLKTLEEPPSRVVFILATTEPHKVLSTILSRCQRFDFRRLTIHELSSRVAKVASSEGVAISNDAIRLIASAAQGAARDALGLLEQCAAYTNGNVGYDDAVAALGVAGFRKVADFCDTIVDGDLAGALTLVRGLIESGRELAQFLKDVLEHFRNLLVLQACGFKLDLIDVPEAAIDDLRRQARSLSAEIILQAIDILSDADSDMRYSASPDLTLEIAAIKLASLKGHGGPAALSKANGDDVVETRSPGRPENADSVADPSTAGRIAAPSTGDDAAGDDAASILENTTHREPETGIRRKSPDDKTGPPMSVRLDEVQEKWESVLGLLKGRSANVGFHYRDGTPTDLTGNELVISFQNEVCWKRGSSKHHREMVRAALKQVPGADLLLKCVLAPVPMKQANGAEDPGVHARGDIPWPGVEDAPPEAPEPPVMPEAVSPPRAQGRGSTTAQSPAAQSESLMEVGEEIAGEVGDQQLRLSPDAPSASGEFQREGVAPGGIVDEVAAGEGVNGNGPDLAAHDEEIAESLARARSAVRDHPTVKAALSVFGGRVFKIEIG